VGTQFSERKALGLGAYDWHAATTENRDVRFLDYTYQTTSAKSLSLYMPNGKKIDVRLREELASWMGSEPSWLGLEPVFVIPERAIICKTKDGWAMFNPKGKPIKYFPSAHLKNGAWHEPVYHKGQFYVCQSSQGAWCYRMDVASGKLVYVGSRVPQ
jgi:hypothetical protein